jgi:rod shape-determining protein MreC
VRQGGAQTRSTGFFVSAAMLTVVAILLTQLPFMTGPREALRGALAPVEAGATAVEGAVGAAGSVFGDISTLRGENRRLTADNARLRAQVAQLQAQGAENDSLRRALAFQRSFGHRTVTAAVISRGPDAFTRSLTIDRGGNEGVRAGMVVVTGAGLVGRVREAGPHSATVQTVADPLIRINAYLVQSALEGTVSGGTGPLRMDVLPRPDAAAKVGEWALTSGLGASYPRGIPIGEVTRYNRNDAATSSVAELAWANDLATLDAVLVVTDFTPQ